MRAAHEEGGHDHLTVGGTILLNGELPTIAGNLTINGGDAITVDGASTYRITETDCSASLTPANVRLAHGNASGTAAAC